jgi:hypothetical protein
MMLENTTPEQKRKFWYENLVVQFEIVKALRHKEFQFIGKGLSIRWLNLQHIKILQSTFDHLHLINKEGNCYMGLDYYKMIPLMSFNLRKRAAQYAEWSENRQENIIGADFGIDLDNKPPKHYTIIKKLLEGYKLREDDPLDIGIKRKILDKTCLTKGEMSELSGMRQKKLLDKQNQPTEKAKKFVSSKNYDYQDVIPENDMLRKLFDKFNVRYGNWMSGSHGFHFVIPYEDMPLDVRQLSYPELINFYKQFALLLKQKCHFIDDTIYMPTRVLKCPYTLTKNGKVILPLGESDWELFKHGALALDPISLYNSNIKLRDRGVYLQGNTDGIKHMIKDWEGWEA